MSTHKARCVCPECRDAFYKAHPWTYTELTELARQLVSRLETEARALAELGRVEGITETGRRFATLKIRQLYARVEK